MFNPCKDCLITTERRWLTAEFKLNKQQSVLNYTYYAANCLTFKHYWDMYKPTSRVGGKKILPMHRCKVRGSLKFTRHMNQWGINQQFQITFIFSIINDNNCIYIYYGKTHLCVCINTYINMDSYSLKLYLLSCRLYCAGSIDSFIR